MGELNWTEKSRFRATKILFLLDPSALPEKVSLPISPYMEISEGLNVKLISPK